MRRASLVVIAVYLLLYIVPLGVRPLFIPDETRYAEISREIIATGDWIVPRLNGLRYFEKPVLGYWLNAASILAFGQNAFAVRFPSAAAAGISAWMIFLLVRRFAGDYTTALFACAAFLTYLEVFAIGVFGVLDSMFAMFVTLSMVVFFFAHCENRFQQKTGLLALFGLCCSLAFLTKGFIGFALPVAAIVPFLIWERRLKELFGLPWIAVVVAVLVLLPWGLMVHFKENDFWHYFFWTEHIKRFMSDSSQHAEPLWFYIPVIFAGALPWTVLLPAAVSGLKNNYHRDPLIRFLICWVICPFLFFSASRGKIGTYILPCFPPLAGLMALGLFNLPNSMKKRLFTIGAAMLAVLTAAAAVVLIISQLADFPDLKVYNTAETWKWILAAGGLATWTFFLWSALKAIEFKRKLLWFCLAPLSFFFISPFIVPDLTVEHKAPGEFLLRHFNRIKPETVLVADEDLAGAACWFYQRNDVYLLGGPGELSYGLGYDDARHRLLDTNRLMELISKNGRTKSVILVARSKHYQSWKDHLPGPLFEESSGPGGCVLAQF